MAICLGEAWSVSPFGFFLTRSWTEPLGISRTYFFCAGYPSCQREYMAQQRREHNALALTNRLTLSFFHPQPDSFMLALQCQYQATTTSNNNTHLTALCPGLLK